MEYLHTVYIKKLSNRIIHLAEECDSVHSALNLKSCFNFLAQLSSYNSSFLNLEGSYQYFSKFDTNFCKTITCYILELLILLQTSQNYPFFTETVIFFCIQVGSFTEDSFYVMLLKKSPVISMSLLMVI